MKTGLAQKPNMGRVGATVGKVGLAIALLCLFPELRFMPRSSAALANIPEPTLLKAQPSTLHCPPGDLSVLVTQLMLDLPSYSNRVIQRSRRLGDSSTLYLLLAGQPEIQPVSLEALADDPKRSRLPVDEAKRNAPAEEIYQIFFTTLERQYSRSSAPASPPVEQALNQAAPLFQQFHWLILARRQDKTASPSAPWQIISLRSQLAPYPSGDDLLAPARDSRSGSVGQGIVVWLRDLHSGAIRLNPASLDSSPANSNESNSHCVYP